MTDRHEENQRRIASYTDVPYCYRNGDGLLRFATQEDFANTLEADGFAPYDPSDDEIRAILAAGGGTLPYFARHGKDDA